MVNKNIWLRAEIAANWHYARNMDTNKTHNASIFCHKLDYYETMSEQILGKELVEKKWNRFYQVYDSLYPL